MPEAQEYLQSSLLRLAESIIPGVWNYNPGCLLDEHKRRDSIFLRQLFHAKKNERRRVLENLHLSVNQLQHRQALDTSMDLSTELNTAKAALKEKIGEFSYYASKQKFASDIQASERCSKFFFRPPQVLHKSLIPVESADALEPTCSAFTTYWSGIFCSPSRKYNHAKPSWNRVSLSALLQHTTSRLSPAQAAYLDSPLTANDFSWALTQTASGKTPGPDGLLLDYYKAGI